MALVDNLISFWELEEASGNRVDSHGSNDLSDSGATLSTTGLVGDCPVIATTNLFHTTNSDLETGDIDWTICGWVKFAGWSTDYTVISKWPFPTSENEYCIYYDQSGAQLAFIIETGGAGVLGTGSTVAIPNLDTAWHFFVAGHDSVNNEIFFSVDNETLVTLPNATGMHDGNGNFELGGIAFGGAFNFTGNIDQVGFWKRKLSAAERTWLYNSGAGRSYAAVLLSGVNLGVYDAEIRDLAWFDTSSLQEGWWDYGMPFEHDLIASGTPTPPVVTGTWPGWITSGSIGWF